MKFKDLPFIVRLATILTFYNTFVMIEEFIIDRFDYWQYLPFYQKGVFCIWDVMALALLTSLLLIDRRWYARLCIIRECRICRLSD